LAFPDLFEIGKATRLQHLAELNVHHVNLVDTGLVGRTFAFDLGPYVGGSQDGGRRRKQTAGGSRGGSQRRSSRWVTGIVGRVVVVQVVQEFSQGMHRGSSRWVTCIVGLEVVIAIVAVTVPVEKNIKLAARNDLPLQRTEFVLAHFVVAEMHFIVVDSSSVSRSERTLLAVAVATIAIVGNSIDNVLLDGDRLCHQVDPVLFGKHVEDISEGLFKKGGLGSGE